VSRVPRAAAWLAVAALAGCYTIRYERRLPPEGGAPREQWHHGLLGGVVDLSGPVKLAEVCPDGFARVESQVTFFNWIGQLLTSGGGLALLKAPVWAPQTVRVACARPVAGTRSLKVVVLGLAPLGGATPATVTIYTEALAGELRRRKGISVIADSDVAALLAAERRREMLTGCSDLSCLAEIGGALGADRVIHGSVGRVGGSLVINISALDARRGRPTASVSERLKRADDEAFLDALPALVDRLLEEAAPAAPAPAPAR